MSIPLDLPLPRPDPIGQLPLLVLFPHSRCNCRCVMCDIWQGSGRELIGPESVRAWLPQWQRLGVRRVVLSGGEALMHPRLWELCAALRDAGIDLTLLSSGLLLARHAADIALHCDEVIVSLDGPPGLHDAIRRVPRAFERLARGIEAVAAAAAAGGAAVSLSGRCTVQRQNYHALRAVVRTARELSLAHISFLAADVSSSAFNRPGGWDAQRTAQIALSEEDLPQLQAELGLLAQEHAEDFASGFIAESPRKLRERLYQHYAALLGRGEFAPNRCNAPWVSTVIETDGTVRPCFFQPPLGNLHRAADLQSILNAPEARSWRAGLDVRRNEICRRCVCTLSMQIPTPCASARHAGA
ncbi:MAG TPA: radical SAM protein [Steroidobacteraceae bacterium]|jgi:MoaA/NifB/PqqE/SkfB family radical SAM enzyme